MIARVYVNEKMGKGDHITSLPVKDAPRYLGGYAVCSDKPIGRAMIARLDALQADEKTWRAWIEPLRHWLNPADFDIALTGVSDMR